MGTLILFRPPTNRFKVLIILLTGLMISSGSLVFTNLPNQINKYKYQTIIYLPPLLINIILNLIFIPKFGIYAAAYASAFSFILSAIFQYIFIFSLYDNK